MEFLPDKLYSDCRLYSLGIVKIKAFDNSHFMHETVRVCHTDHTDSIIACIACFFDF